MDLRGNLGNLKEKPARKICLSHEKKGKILPGGISLMSTKFLLHFHEKKVLKRGRVFEKV